MRATRRARDRLARRGLLVLARVAEPRRDGDHAVRRGADRRVDHAQQLHQRVVGGDPGVRVAAGRLDDEHVGAADRLLVAAVDLAVGERLQRHGPELDAELVGDLARRAPGWPGPRTASAACRSRSARLRGHAPAAAPRPASAPPSYGASSSTSAHRCRRCSARSRSPRCCVWRARATPSAPAGTSSVITSRPPSRRRRRPSTGATKRRVDAAPHARADRRAVLVATVVVGGDRAGAEVGARPDVGVAEVGEVRHLRALADVGVLDLDERADLRAVAQHRAGAQVGERADADAVVAARSRSA